MLLSVTVTLPTMPVRPETAMDEGYGAAGPTSGIAIPPGLHRVDVTGVAGSRRTQRPGQLETKASVDAVATLCAVSMVTNAVGGITDCVPMAWSLTI